MQERKCSRVAAEAEFAAEAAATENQREFSKFTATLAEQLSTVGTGVAQQAMMKTMRAHVAVVHDRDPAYGGAWNFVVRHDLGQATPDSISVVGQVHRAFNPQAGIAAAARAASSERYPPVLIALDWA